MYTHLYNLVSATGPEPVEKRGDDEVVDGQAEGGAITWIWTGDEGGQAPEELGRSGGGSLSSTAWMGVGLGKTRSMRERERRE